MSLHPGSTRAVRGFALAACCALAAAAAVAALAADSPPAAAAPPTAAAASPKGLPPGLAPLTPELAKPLPDLERAAEKYRGLSLRRPVPAGMLGGAALRREVDRQMAEDMAPGTLAALDAALKAFGLIPESMDLATYYPALLSSQIAAFYDPERKYLAIVDLGSQGDEQVTKELGAEFAERARQAVLVHELTHALQDQAFDMSGYVETDPLSDASVARLALVEGDATGTMMDFVLGRRIEAVPGAADLLGPALSEGASTGAPGFPGSKEIAAAPAWFRESLLFSYLRGFGFCVAVRQRGGQKLLDYAFAKDPPRSSEQVLHPEKWFGRRDDPVAITFPDLLPLLPGARKVAGGELGEEGIRILLPQPPGGAAHEPPAGAGWGGDRFAVYQRPGGGRLLAWVTEWDSEGDATAFLAAAGRLGSGWTLRRTAPTRVVVLHGPFAASAPAGGTAGEAEPVIARLAAASAVRPPDRPIDLAALGIRPQAAAKSEEHPAPAPDPERLPAAAAAPEPPDGERALPHFDGRRFSNSHLGFRVLLPQAGGPWRLAPRGTALFGAESADGAVVLAVHDEDLEEPAPPLTARGTAMAQAAESAGGRVLHAGLNAGGADYEIELESGPPGAGRRHQRLLLVARNGRLIVISGETAAAAWDAHAAMVEEFLASLRPVSEARKASATSPAAAPRPPPAPPR